MSIHVLQLGIDNCYVIKHEGTILIDGGRPGEFDKFSKQLECIHVRPEEIQAIIITHCHWDHIGCAKDIKDMTGAKVIVHQSEKNILENGERVMPPGVTLWGKLLGSLLNAYSKKFTIKPCKVDISVGEGNYSLLEFGIKENIVFTPGHSPGSISVVLDSGDAFVGDMAMNGLPLTLGPNLPIFGEMLIPLVPLPSTCCKWLFSAVPQCQAGYRKQHVGIFAG